MTPTIPNIPDIPQPTAAKHNELEELRRQMADFKARLDSQKIISERMLRSVIDQRFSGIMMFVKVEAFVLLPLIALCFLFTCIMLNTSWWFYGATLLMTATSTTLDYLINRPSDLVNSSLVTIMRRIERQKRQRLITLAASIPVVIVWVIWYIAEINAGGSDLPIAAIIIGAVGGAAAGLVIFLRQQRSLTRSVNDINLMLNSNDTPAESL